MEQQFDLYRDMAMRTDGQIYLGVVGPVRTGKSTFIKRFMELAVLPAVEDAFARERMIDELPQSAAGRTIMTTQPNFVPDRAAELKLGDSVARVRLIDCVGYLTRGALGYLENGQARQVKTPWSEEEMPFEEAAELGTRKVIEDHATVGLVITTDGSITELPRAGYIEAEERVIAELKALGKPFAVVLNTTSPQDPDTTRLAAALSEKYDVAVCPLNVDQMGMEDLENLLLSVLNEFPLREVQLEIPSWAQALPWDHWLPQQLMEGLRRSSEGMMRMRDCDKLLAPLSDCDSVIQVKVEIKELATGNVRIAVTLKDGLYYQLLSEACGMPVKGDYHLLQMLRDFAEAKRVFDRFEEAIRSATETGYGMVPPTVDEMMLEEPQIVHQGGRFGVKLKASAPSLHLMRVQIETEVSPIVGSEKQSEELLNYMLSEFESDPKKIWETNLFGKSLHDLVKEGLASKLTRMPDDVRMKMSQTLSRIINEGTGNMICILL
nr:stage IV sporulation protein A [bacterium]